MNKKDLTELNKKERQIEFLKTHIERIKNSMSSSSEILHAVVDKKERYLSEYPVMLKDFQPMSDEDYCLCYLAKAEKRMGEICDEFDKL